MDVDDLYGLPLERFIPERMAMVRALRVEGDRDEATAVSRLRKPSVAAWAVNQLVRTQRKAMTELFDAGDSVRDAHENVLSGRGDGRALRAALERERAATDVLTNAARGLLSSEGHELSATTVERVSGTLHAAALEDEAREKVRGGRLERELRHIGLGPLAKGAANAPGRARPTSTKPSARPRDAGARRQAEESHRPEEERRRAVEERRRAERTKRALQVAQNRRDRAARALTDAQRALAEAEQELREAEESLAEARTRAKPS